jgi:hypothetical protein
MSISNEIQVFETLPPSFTTFRTTTYKTPSRAAEVPILSKNSEVLQTGTVPPPSYASTLTCLKLRRPAVGVAVLVGGNVRTNHAATPIQVMMGLKDIWAEVSTGDIYTLEFDLDSPSFKWSKQTLQISQRAHHSAMLVDHLLYIFGGTDYSTNLRYELRPVVIDTISWTVTNSIVSEDFPDKFLSGQSFLHIDDKSCLAVGGYSTLEGKDKDIANDEVVRMKVEDGQVSVTV